MANNGFHLLNPRSWFGSKGAGVVTSQQEMLAGLAYTPLGKGGTGVRGSDYTLRVKGQEPEVWCARSTVISKALGLEWEVRPINGVPLTPELREAAKRAKLLFSRPNTRFTTFAKCFDRLMNDFYPSGAWFLEIETDPAGIPVGLWNIPADQMSVRQLGSPRDWKWVQRTQSGQERVIDPQFIVTAIRRPDYELQGDGYDVLSTLITRLMNLDLANGADFGTDGAFRDGLLQAPGAMQAELDALGDKINQRVGAGQKSGLILTALYERLEKVKLRDSNVERQMSDYRRDLARLIWNFHGATPLDAGFPDGQNRAIAAVSRQMSNEGIFKGDMELCEDSFTVIAQLFHPQLRFEFPTLDTLDPLSMADLRLKQSQVTHTVNELRAELSMSPVPEGDMILGMKATQQQTADAPEPGTTPGADESDTPQEAIKP